MKGKGRSGTVRIIGGKWRSRRLQVPEEGVRPTPDAVRETVFNWLAPIIPGAICLDLFSGTGALGFEALSRGAGFVDFVDGAHVVVKKLKSQIEIFETTSAQVHHIKLPEGLGSLPAKKYGLVFIDAPFGQNLLPACCEWLDKNQVLEKGAYIYIEKEKELLSFSVPSTWVLWRSKLAGKISYCVYKLE